MEHLHDIMALQINNLIPSSMVVIICEVYQVRIIFCE